jgi:hypothetical protein
MNVKKLVFALSICFCAFSEPSQAFPTPVLDTLPRVFLLGVYDGGDFEQLKEQYSMSLVQACRSDMETAYYSWIHMLKHLESYSKTQNFDLDGVKMWLYVFWNKDGSIQHLAFYLKQNSRNVDKKAVTTFLEGFCSQYKSPIKAEKNFSNYSSATFPVMIEKEKEPEKVIEKVKKD